MVKIGHLDDAFLEDFLTASKPSKRSITAERRKKSKIEKSEDVGHLLVDFCARPGQNVVKGDTTV